MFAIILEPKESVFNKLSTQCEAFGICAFWAIDEEMMFEQLIATKIDYIITRKNYRTILPDFLKAKGIIQISIDQLDQLVSLKRCDF